MVTGIGFVALLTGALAQRFLHGERRCSPETTPGEAEMLRRLGEMSHQIAELQKALAERRE